MRLFLSCLAIAFGLVSATVRAQVAEPSAAWQFQQTFEVTTPGLLKISLPLETMDQARAGLEDLRLYDLNGREVPFVLERPRPVPKVTRPARDVRVTLANQQTIITFGTGLAEPIEAVSLESPAPEFIKAVTVSGSNDRNAWQNIATGQPVFRQKYGISQMRITFPAPVKWEFLRLVVDDRRSSPVPFVNALVHAAAPEKISAENLPVSIRERHENPRETRISLDLKSANLDISSVRIETGDPLFMRQVAVAVPVIAENSVREQTIAQGTIYRVEIQEEAVKQNLEVQVEHQVRSRELLLLINNQDSPPLNVAKVRIERRPLYLVFYAQQPGTYRLLSGNPRAEAPRYDLAGLSANLRGAPAREVKFSSLDNNPGYRTPEVLPGIGAEGAQLDVAGWGRRKPVIPTATGVQELELDLDVLSYATSGLADLRILRGTTQVPFILEHTSISRSLAPTVTLTNVPNYPRVSRWIVKLPRVNLPINRLSCASDASLFRRDFVLWEEAEDDRGNPYRRDLGSATWVRTPDQAASEFLLSLQARPKSDTLFLETDNGDNPAIELEDFKAFYPATRLLFKGKASEQLLLYYGNERTGAPTYDLGLVAGQLLSAAKHEPTVGKEEQVRKTPWAGARAGKGGVVFWGILALVVIVLLVIISRLLPKVPPAKDA